MSSLYSLTSALVCVPRIHSDIFIFHTKRPKMTAADNAELLPSLGKFIQIFTKHSSWAQNSFPNTILCSRPTRTQESR